MRAVYAVIARRWPRRVPRWTGPNVGTSLTAVASENVRLAPKSSLTGQVPIISLRDPRRGPPPLPHAVAKGCPYRCPRLMPNVLSHHVFARGHRSMPARQLSPGWSPHCRPFASADCACRAVLARRHASMPARQSPEWPLALPSSASAVPTVLPRRRVRTTA